MKSPKKISFLSMMLTSQLGAIGFGIEKFSVLRNEEGDDQVIGGGEGIDFSDEGGDEGSDDSNDLLETPHEEVFKNLGLDPKKYGFGAEAKDENAEIEPEEVDAAAGAGQATDEKSLLEQINSLGAIHNELPVTVESRDQLKELIQKGQDYTVKTQALSEERKVWDTEKTAAETELNAAISEFNNTQKAYESQLNELQQWTFTLGQLAETRPDLHEEILREFNGTKKQFENPILNQQLSEVNRRLKDAEDRLASRENKLVLSDFDRGMADLKATEQSMKELGINIDKEKVKERWIATGLPVNEVVGSMYFDQLTKAQASKAKVATTKAKVGSKPIGAAAGSRPGTKAPVVDRKLSYREQARVLFNNMK